MTDTNWAVLFAIIAAMLTATFQMIARRGQVYGNAVTGVMIGVIVNLPLLLIATCYYWEPSWWNPWAITLFFLAGMVTTGLGRFLLYTSIHRLGLSRSAPLISSLPLFTAILAFGILDERPGPYIWVGTVFIVVGCISIASRKGESGSWNLRLIWLPFCAVISFAVGNIFRKAGLNELPSPLFGGTVTYIAGLLFLALFSLMMPKNQKPNLRWGKAWAFYGGCGFVNLMAFLSRYTATRYGDLTVITPLFATTSFFALILSAIFLRDLERVTAWIVGGTVLIVGGATLITWRVL